MGCHFSSPLKGKFKKNNNKQSGSSGEKRKNLVFKILLLGAGESGKTTVAKQMKIIHGKGYQDADRLKYVEVIQKNLLDFVKQVLEGIRIMEIYVEPKNKNLMNEILNMITVDEPIEKIVDKIKIIQTDKGFKEAIIRGNEIQLNESHIIFLKDLDRITSDVYIPTDDDILHTRLKTLGIFEYEFPYRNFTIKLIDVGGQRGQRKKWINCFEEVNSMIYVCSLIDYCLLLEEDSVTNRLTESVKLFGAMLNSPFFNEIPIILFLNKKDLFEEKIKTCPLNKYFPQYQGNDFDSAVMFIQNMYLTANQGHSRTIYVHITNATDTSNIKFVFDAVADIIFEKTMKEIGLYS